MSLMPCDARPGSPRIGMPVFAGGRLRPPRRWLTIGASLALVVAAITLAVPPGAHAQSVSSILSGMRDGGGWVGIPIEGGKGSYTTVRLPTARMTLDGCVNVWYGHSGKWTIEARDSITDSTLVIDAEPGIGVPFSHKFGMQAKIDFDFRWSEPRDTTLMLWVGVDMDGEGGEPPVCNPY